MKQAILPFVDTKLKHKLSVREAYDYRGTSKNNYGYSEALLVFLVSGAYGAVSLNYYTGWYTAGVNKKQPSERVLTFCDLSSHSYENLRPEDEYSTIADCAYLDGGKCYGKSYCIDRNAWEEGLINGGSDWVFKKLEEFYSHVFCEEPYPDLTTPKPYNEELLK